MSGLMQYEFHLFGGYKGRTMTINGHVFRNGVARLAISSEALGACAKVLTSYGAYARGTQEYLDAEEKEKAADAVNDILKASDVGSNDPVRSEVRPVGAQPTPPPTDASAGDTDPQWASGPDSDPAGHGHQHAGVPQFPEDKDFQPSEPSSSVNVSIKAAVLKLDPEVDDHWVQTGAAKGLPKLNAVEQAYGKANLTRQDVDAAAPSFNRDRAYETALAATA